MVLITNNKYQHISSRAIKKTLFRLVDYQTMMTLDYLQQLRDLPDVCLPEGAVWLTRSW